MRVSLAAIVLAGGQSSRMGQDKALISIQGTPLLQRICTIALQCTPLVYVVTPWTERYRALLPPACHLIPEQLAPGSTQAHGPLLGFAQGLAQVSTEAQTDWVLLLACDLPRLDAIQLQVWTRTLGNVQPQVIARLPKSEKSWEPLCGFYRTSCLTNLQAAIARGERSFQRWLAQESVQELEVTDPTVLFNCNTPTDLQQLTGGTGVESERKTPKTDRGIE